MHSLIEVEEVLVNVPGVISVIRWAVFGRLVLRLRICGSVGQLFFQYQGIFRIGVFWRRVFGIDLRFLGFNASRLRFDSA